MNTLAIGSKNAPPARKIVCVIILDILIFP
nr:MAG TPA: hypothetical protein [Inoviridae sp.]